MSAFVTIKTEFEDPACVVEALKELGYEPEVHEEPQALEGYHGDARAQRAEIIVRRSQIGGSSNDFGFYKDGDGKYQLWLSQFDQSFVPRKHKLQGVQGLTNKLAQSYAVHKVTKTARKERWKVKTAVQQDGSVKVKLSAWK